MVAYYNNKDGVHYYAFLDYDNMTYSNIIWRLKIEE